MSSDRGSSRFTIHPGRLAVMLAFVVGFVTLLPEAALMLGILVGLIVLHEGGHLLAAKATGMKATEYFVGFGPHVISMRVGETDYGIKGILAGGYVKIIGMTSTAEVDEVDEPRAYRAASLPRRLIVVLAGPFANFAVAVAIMAGAAAVLGAPAADGGRDRVGAVEAVEHGVEWTVDGTQLTLQGLSDFAGSVGEYRSAVVDPEGSPTESRFLSPVGASRLAGQAAAEDLYHLLTLAAIFSVSLAVFNLLPVPPLDGGHAVVAVVERAASAVARRRVSVSARLLNATAVAVLTLMIGISLTSVWFDVRTPLASPFG